MVVGVLAVCASAALAQAPDPIAPQTPLPLRATPMLAEKRPQGEPAATIVTGDEITGRADLETTVQGAAELRRPGLALWADTLTFDQSTDTAHAQGHVRINAQGNRYTGTQGQLQVDAFSGFLLQPSYRLLANGAHGDAQRIDFQDNDRATVLRGDYTTCERPGPDWVPDWILRASKLEIDQEEEVGRAQGAVLAFKGVPILPVPSMQFPLSNARQSGWLPPTLGLDSTSGMVLSAPWYWNIAPNRDATLTPTVMSRRGVDVAGEFRYKENNYEGSVAGDVMPGDRLRQRNRWGLFTRHNGRYDTGIDALGTLGVGLNINRVSDNDYWRDFTQRGLPLTTRLLGSEGGLSWAHGDFSATLRALKWQTLQDVSAPIIPPYDRLPQLAGRWGRTNDGGFDYSIDADFTRFRADPFWTQQPNGDRGFVLGQISRPMLRPWGFFTPRLQLHATHYQFSTPLADGRTAANRLLPTVSLDSGLVFERDARYFGRGFTQTLEPRLKYVYTPYRNQNGLPSYDSGLYDFNFATIWADNVFAGNDRFVDSNLITAGLTSRLLDPQTGAEAVRLGVAQRYRFSAQQVVLPGGVPAARGLSDIMLGAGINWDPRWAFDTVVQYNRETHQSTRTTVQARYSPGPFRTVSLAYRLQRDLGTKSLDVGWQWPLGGGGVRGELGARRSGGGGSCGGQWYSVGRLNYSMPDQRVVEGLLGFEYDAGCWIGRVVVEKVNSSLSSSTKRIMFQLELIGLSRLGSSPLRSLRNSIPHYQQLRPDATPPSRFTDYE